MDTHHKLISTGPEKLIGSKVQLQLIARWSGVPRSLNRATIMTGASYYDVMHTAG